MQQIIMEASEFILIPDVINIILEYLFHRNYYSYNWCKLRHLIITDEEREVFHIYMDRELKNDIKYGNFLLKDLISFIFKKEKIIFHMYFCLNQQHMFYNVFKIAQNVAEFTNGAQIFHPLSFTTINDLNVYYIQNKNRRIQPTGTYFSRCSNIFLTEKNFPKLTNKIVEYSKPYSTSHTVQIISNKKKYCEVIFLLNKLIDIVGEFDRIYMNLERYKIKHSFSLHPATYPFIQRKWDQKEWNYSGESFLLYTNKYLITFGQEVKKYKEIIINYYEWSKEKMDLKEWEKEMGKN